MITNDLKCMFPASMLCCKHVSLQSRSAVNSHRGGHHFCCLRHYLEYVAHVTPVRLSATHTEHSIWTSLAVLPAAQQTSGPDVLEYKVVAADAHSFVLRKQRITFSSTPSAVMCARPLMVQAIKCTALYLTGTTHQAWLQGQCRLTYEDSQSFMSASRSGLTVSCALTLCVSTYSRMPTALSSRACC